MGSSPTRKWLSRQSEFCGTPVLALSERLSMVRFAHHFVALQPKPSNCGTQPGS